MSRELLFIVPLFIVLLLPLAWHEGVREWDQYASYSCVVVEKGLDHGIFESFFTDFGEGDLYITLKDDGGNRSKKYVGTSSSRFLDWYHLKVGSFVVKNKGFGQFPHEPDKAIPSISP
jgi:hypothetical protein